MPFNQSFKPAEGVLAAIHVRLRLTVKRNHCNGVLHGTVLRLNEITEAECFSEEVCGSPAAEVE
jgi:hypothetical protein